MIPNARPATRGSRAVHGIIASTFATFTALLSHVLGGGEMPGWLGVLAPWILATTVCVLLAGRRLSAVRITLSVVVSQFLFHALFVLGAPRAVASTGAAHQHHDHTALAPHLIGDSAAAAATASSSMWVAHAVAALATAAVLYRAEKVWGLLRALAARIASWVARRVEALPACIQQRPAPAPADAPVLRPLGLSFTATLWRGPPLSLSL